MKRVFIINRIGGQYLTSNGEYSYVKEAGSKEKLIRALGYEPEHIFLDMRFENKNVVVLVETKQNFTKKDENQLREYLDEEKALHRGKKIICILANTTNEKFKIWKHEIDDEHFLNDEIILDTMEHYEKLFNETNKQNDREKVLKNTYSLNESLHKKDIDEKLRSQFVGTTLLYIKNVLYAKGINQITEDTRKELKEYWGGLSEKQIRIGIQDTLEKLLDGFDNKTLKIELLQKNILNDQKIRKLKISDWLDILDEILWNIYKYINTNSSEGQDILNLFFTAFNKYKGKDDKNQAFTPDHITHFMCKVIGVDYTKRLFDGICGSGSFLVQGMVLELADLNKQKLTKSQKEMMCKKIAKNNIYGIEIEEQAFGLATTNMLIHGDGNSNIKNTNIFDSEDFIREANPNIILMNPPYNAKPITIPETYKSGWKKDAKEDPTKGMVFLKFVSDVIKKMNDERINNGETKKEVKLAILLPVSTAIGTSKFIKNMKSELLEDNTLDAVFTLPNEIFSPGASASVCCMIFTLGKPHKNLDGTVNKTFFGYYKDDGHKKKKNLGRVEQFDKNNNSIWKKIEEEWLDLYRNKIIKDGMSAMQTVSGNDEWLCEAYMKTDYSKLSAADFQKAVNNYLAYMVITKNKSRQTLDLKIDSWKEFSVGDLFSSIIKGKCDNASNLIDGNEINYIGAKYNNNGLMKSCAKSENIDFISPGNCIAMIGQGEGSAGYAIYLDSDFIGASLDMLIG